MPTTIELTTLIDAPITVCFNLSRSVELHKISTDHTNEQVIAGRISGLFEEGDTVTWRARHFGIYQQLEMKISEMQFPFYFEDCMTKGVFKSIVHQHYFTQTGNIVSMNDKFQYDVPYGFAGKLFNSIVLKSYMTRLLILRNHCIKNFAESGEWKNILALSRG